jgi:hypothetical protein
MEYEISKNYVKRKHYVGCVKHEQPPFIKRTSIRRHTPGSSIIKHVYTKKLQK